MSEKYSALIYILVISFIGFTIAKFVCKDTVPQKEFYLWRKAWFLVTISIFTIPNFWVFVLISIFLITYLSKLTEHKIALYFILLFSAPYINLEIPGIGSINYFLSCNFPRVLSLFLLLPEAIRISKANREFKFGKVWTDRWIMIYMILWWVLVTLSYGVTSGMRIALYTTMQLILPYYVISRGIKTVEQMKNSIFALITGALILALIGIFENRKSWLVYNSLFNEFGAPHIISNYITRGSELRAVATFEQPIILGFFLAVMFGFYLLIYHDIKGKFIKLLAAGILLMGILAPISRGPWLGLGVCIALYAIQGRNKLKKLGASLLAAIVIIASLNFLPNGQKYLDLIPFVGHTDYENVVYRQKLLNNAMSVIARQPFFGSQGTLDFRYEPEMVELRQGQGIVDIVNTYLLEALQAGCVTMLCMIFIHISVLFRVIRYKTISRRLDKDLENTGSMLIALILSIMTMIATVGAIEHIPYIINIVLALGIAYTRIIQSIANDRLKSN